jgi:hypothetical protein
MPGGLAHRVDTTFGARAGVAAPFARGPDSAVSAPTAALDVSAAVDTVRFTRGWRRLTRRRLETLGVLARGDRRDAAMGPIGEDG